MTGKEYFAQLIPAFPALKEHIEDWEEDMIHLRMEEFARYTNNQVKDKNKVELMKCFEFQEERIELMDQDLDNALNVSYCESLLFGECADHIDEVLPLMGPKLKAQYQDYEKWYNDLANNQE